MFGRIKDAADNFMIGTTLKVKNAVRRFAEGEDGDIVQTVIIIGIFAALAVAVVILIGNAVRGRATDAANTINGYGTYNAPNVSNP